MQTAHYPPDVMARFWMKVRKDESGCWLWTGSQTVAGYGQFDHRAGHHGLAHRLSYEMLKGAIPEGLVLDHLCRVRNCVAPHHLEPCTLVENIMRGEGPAAINARKTHCPQGHLLSGENVYPDARGKRGCKACRHASNIRAWRKRKLREQQEKEAA